MFHAVSVTANVEMAIGLVYRFSRVDAGMRLEQIQPSLTAVIDGSLTSLDDGGRFAIGMLEANSVRVRTLGEATEIAGEVRQDLRA
jgi:hypothetical protein